MAPETELMYSVIHYLHFTNVKIEISTQFGAGTEEENLNLIGEIPM